MPGALDFIPIFSETLNRVRARMDADANAGLDTTDPAFIDIREGTFYWDMTQVAALEFARLWDSLATETPAAAFPTLAWGEYLDEHAATFGLSRNPAVSATGQVLFTGTAGTPIAQGSLVSALPSDPSQDAITYATQAAGVVSAAVPAPSTGTAIPDTSSGSLPAATYIYHLTSYNGYGESVGSADIVGTLSATGRMSLTWSAVTGAVGYNIYRTLVPGLGQLIGSGTATAFMDLGSTAPGLVEPTVDTTTGVILPVSAIIAGTAGNLGADAVTLLETVNPPITAVTNPAPMVGGTDVENDEALRGRILAQFTGQGAGNRADYVRWSLATQGVERAVCIPVWAGPGTVLVIAMLADGSPVASGVVAGLQTQLDPTPGQGHGQAPIGATVTVATTVALDIDIVGSVVFRPGYSLDGGSGTIATRTEIVSALTTYTQSLNPGDTLSYQAILSAFFAAEGVIRVNSLTVNTATADIVLGTSPAQYAFLDVPVLT